MRDVAVPPGLLERLKAIPLADDDGLDEALRDVPVPDDLVAACRRHARRYFARPFGWARHAMDSGLRFSRIAMAASLILAVTLSLGSAMLFTWYLNGSDEVAKNVPARSPLPSPPTPAENGLETSWLDVDRRCMPGPVPAAFAAG